MQSWNFILNTKIKKQNKKAAIIRIYKIEKFTAKMTEYTIQITYFYKNLL